jgi:lactate dehydrogenase-like 2-hydroxyacid dehydrogenase
LFRCANSIFSLHVAGLTRHAYAQTAEACVSNVMDVLSHSEPSGRMHRTEKGASI